MKNKGECTQICQNLKTYVLASIGKVPPKYSQFTIALPGLFFLRIVYYQGQDHLGAF